MAVQVVAVGPYFRQLLVGDGGVHQVQDGVELAGHVDGVTVGGHDGDQDAEKHGGDPDQPVNIGVGQGDRRDGDEIQPRVGGVGAHDQVVIQAQQSAGVRHALQAAHQVLGVQILAAGEQGLAAFGQDDSPSAF